MTLWDVEVTLICPSKIGSEGRLNSPTAFGIHAGMTCNVCGTHVGGSLECFLLVMILDDIEFDMWMVRE